MLKIREKYELAEYLQLIIIIPLLYIRLVSGYVQGINPIIQ